MRIRILRAAWLPLALAIAPQGWASAAPSPGDPLDDPLPILEPTLDPLFVGPAGHAVDTSQSPPCGGDVPCGCGMRLTESTLLRADLTACSGIGIRIDADDVILDCGGRCIEGDGWGTGVWSPGRRGIVIRNCVIRGFRVGVLASPGLDVTLENCVFEENGIAGIWMRGGEGSTLRSNRFERCGVVGLGRKHGGAVTLDRCRGGVVEGNTALDCGNGQLHVGGILLYDSDRNRIEGNRLERVAEDNIWIRMGSDDNQVLRNVIHDSGMDGIWIRESDGNRVEGNDVEGAERYGIFVRSGRRNLVLNNDVLRAGRERYAGIGVGGLERASTENTVAGNRIGLSTEGLRVEERAHGNRFEGNEVRGCATGVRLGEGIRDLPNRFIRERIEESGGPSVLVAGERMLAHFIDASFGGGAILFDGPCRESRVEIRWLLDVLVEDQDGHPVPGAEVTLRDARGDTVFQGASAADGAAPRIEAVAFARTKEGTVDYNDHLLRVRREGYAPEERSFRLEGNRTERFVLTPVRTGVGGAGERSTSIASALLTAAPNPVREGTRLLFSLAEPGPATLRVYDLRGRAVTTLADGSFAAGAHDLSWDRRDDAGRPVPSGVYFVRLLAGGRSRMVKLIVAAP
ncbi:MAG: right-handed parallel beta-helix repeat-containing protein [Candidatus Eisenbacteria bacterium]|nr:right-handed parallel beta-helix repeat-containing protein [Candidatus Eisenbacteria bacterium]